MMNFVLQRTMQELLESSGFEHVIDFIFLSPASLLPPSRQNKLKSAKHSWAKFSAHCHEIYDYAYCTLTS